MKFFSFLLLSITSIFPSFSGLSQDLKWDWIKQNSQTQASTWSYILDCDYQNNVYIGNQYSDSICFGDTLFAHTGYEYFDWANWAVAKYNNQGQFLGALDITTEPGNILFNVKLITDKDLNMYIIGQFQKAVYLLDTTIHNGNNPISDDPELFISKITPSFNIEWVRLISSASAEECDGFIIADNYLYLIALHYGNGGSIDTVNYFGQDTAYCDNNLCSILKIDLDGNLVWRKKLYNDLSGIIIRDLTTDNFSNLLFYGLTQHNFIYYNDTIFHPYPEEYTYRPFFITIDTSGNLFSGKIPDWNIGMSDIKTVDSDYFYCVGFVWDTAIFAGDTLIQYDDSSKTIIAKLDSDYEPVWYQTTSSSIAQGSHYFYIDTFQDTLFFAGRCNNTLKIFDTIFYLGASDEIFIGKVTPQGNLDKFIYTNSIGGASPKSLLMDNCNNLLLAGRFKGMSIFGEDTLYSNNPASSDGFISKIFRLKPFDLGTDTVVYDSILITAPEGFQYYYWNDSLSSQSIVIKKSGEYILACGNDNGCWVRDTINITVLITVPELQKINVRVYPNPTEDMLFISSEKRIDRIEMSDIQGKIFLKNENRNIMKKPVNIEISDIPPGIYFLKINIEDTIGIVKIIKI